MKNHKWLILLGLKNTKKKLYDSPKPHDSRKSYGSTKTWDVETNCWVFFRPELHTMEETLHHNLDETLHTHHRPRGINHQRRLRSPNHWGVKYGQVMRAQYDTVKYSFTSLLIMLQFVSTSPVSFFTFALVIQKGVLQTSANQIQVPKLIFWPCNAKYAGWCCRFCAASGVLCPQWHLLSSGLWSFAAGAWAACEPRDCYHCEVGKVECGKNWNSLQDYRIPCDKLLCVHSGYGWYVLLACPDLIVTCWLPVLTNHVIGAAGNTQHWINGCKPSNNDPYRETTSFGGTPFCTGPFENVASVLVAIPPHGFC